MKQPSARTAVVEQSHESKGLFSHSCPSMERSGRLGNHRSLACRRLILISVFCLCAGISARATVTLVSIQSPGVSASQTSPVNSPVHFEATAESDLHVTGYVVYVDDRNVYQTMGSLLDAWVILPPDTTHSVYVRAWDASGSFLASPTYQIRVTGLVPPIPPANAARITNLVAPSLVSSSSWVVDNKSHVGGQCNHGSIGTFANSFDPNTRNAPDVPDFGQHWLVNSQCQYDDSLFYWKHVPGGIPESTNFLWDLWFYIPTTTDPATVQAIEFDLFQNRTLRRWRARIHVRLAVPLSQQSVAALASARWRPGVGQHGSLSLPVFYPGRGTT